MAHFQSSTGSHLTLIEFRSQTLPSHTASSAAAAGVAPRRFHNDSMLAASAPTCHRLPCGVHLPSSPNKAISISICSCERCIIIADEHATEELRSTVRFDAFISQLHRVSL